MDYTSNAGRAGRNPIYGGGPSATGPSPIILDYTVDLTTVPPNVRITRAYTTYQSGGQSAIVTDNGGSGYPSIEWGADAIRQLNASMLPDGSWPANFAVHASCSFGPQPPQTNLVVMVFDVEFINPSTN